MYKYYIETTNGGFTTTSDLKIEHIQRMLPISGHLHARYETVCIGEYVFRKTDVKFVKMIK